MTSSSLRGVNSWNDSATDRGKLHSAGSQAPETASSSSLRMLVIFFTKNLPISFASWNLSSCGGRELPVSCFNNLLVALKSFPWSVLLSWKSPYKRQSGRYYANMWHGFDVTRYEVGIPWKESCLRTSNEYTLCVTRLRQPHSWLKRNKELVKDYNNVIKEQVKSGMIEAVPESDENEQLTHFFPHHGVIQQDRETTKTDKSTPSINECLQKGPNLMLWWSSEVI